MSFACCFVIKTSQQNQLILRGRSRQKKIYPETADINNHTVGGNMSQQEVKTISFIILLFKFFQNRFGEGTHIWVHQGICLGEIRYMRFQTDKLCAETPAAILPGHIYKNKPALCLLLSLF